MAGAACWRAKMNMPSINVVWAYGGYAGKLVAWVAQRCRILLESVRKPEGQRASEVLPAPGVDVGR